MDDLTEPLTTSSPPLGSALSATPQPQATPDSDGWSDLMRLAAEFPLEALSFGVDVTSQDVPTIVLPQPRSFSHELSSGCLADLVDSAGDGPLIGLGAGMSLAGR